MQCEELMALLAQPLVAGVIGGVFSWAVIGLTWSIFSSGR